MVLELLLEHLKALLVNIYSWLIISLTAAVRAVL